MLITPNIKKIKILIDQCVAKSNESNIQNTTPKFLNHTMDSSIIIINEIICNPLDITL